ncbi:MAG: hypothetical protein E6G56_07080 [Actinobacteria bacterium]|nr:MAG: hypothetical protein E6G56_07080 [Actinomycetota bacterium]
MRLRAIHPGDVVKVNKRGRLFHAHVRGIGPADQLAIEPIERGISYRHATAREVIDHWARGGPRERQPPEQYTIDHLLDS